jgi:hypothetical protein
VRIVRVARAARRYEFRVYPRAHAHEELGVVIQLMRSLSSQGWPYRVADAPGLLLSVGPLSAAQSASFAQQWPDHME